MASICVFGDSIGRGVVYDNSSNRYTVLNECFSNLVQKETGAKIKNLAAFGSTIERGIKIVGRHINELKGYDRILLEFGGNDCDFDWAGIAENPNGKYEPKTPIHVFEAKYLELVQNIKQAGSKPLLINMPPIDAVRYFKQISRGLNANAILEWLGDKEHIYRWHEMYNIAVCRIAALTATPLVDIRSAFLEKKDCMKHICDDGIHPNSKGHKLISEVVTESLGEMQSRKLSLQA